MIGIVSWEVIDVGSYNALSVTEYLEKESINQKENIFVCVSFVQSI